MRNLSRSFLGSVVSAFLACAVEAAPFAYITNGPSGTASVIDTATTIVTAIDLRGTAARGLRNVKPSA